MRKRLVSYSPYSRGVRDLGRSSGILRLRSDSRFRPRDDDLLINWGCSSFEGRLSVDGGRVINPPSSVLTASNKLKTFMKFQEHQVATVPWTTDLSLVNEWKADGKIIVARSVLNGHSGAGITIVECDDPLSIVEAASVKLWTQYVKKRLEARVHVFHNRVIDVQEKRRRNGVETSHRIQNLANGYVFCREDVEEDSRRDEIAISAITACALDFGAVDLIYNGHYDKWMALEVNTAPGLVGTTLDRYAAELQSLS